MGRGKIKIDRAELERCIQAGKSLSEIGLELKVSRSTVNARIKEYGIGIGRGKYKRTFRRRQKHSIVHDKLLSFSGQTLPGDPEKLGRILGIDKGIVRAYLKRGRRSSERFILEVLGKAAKTSVMVDTLGRSIPLGAILSMQVALDQWGRSVKIVATLKAGYLAVFNYKVKDLWEILE